MKVIVLFIIYIFINFTAADNESYEDPGGKDNKQAKRCGPEYIDADESSGCGSSETTVRMVRTTPVTTTTTVKSIPKGPLFDFIVNICNSLLTKFSHDKVSNYFNVLNKSLRGLGSGYLMKTLMNRFCDKLKKLSYYNGKRLRVKVIKFLEIITEGNAVMNEFFLAINPIYKIWDDNEMDDYIYLLRKYGQGKTSHIGERTREIFQSLVFYRLNKQKDSTRSNIELKFNLAVIEYHDEI